MEKLNLADSSREKAKPVIFIIIIAIIIMLVVVNMATANEGGENSYNTSLRKVEIVSYADSASANGTVEYKSSDIFLPYGAIITNINFNSNDWVKEGDMLFKADVSEYDTQIETMDENIEYETAKLESIESIAQATVNNLQLSIDEINNYYINDCNEKIDTLNNIIDINNEVNMQNENDNSAEIIAGYQNSIDELNNEIRNYIVKIDEYENEITNVEVQRDLDIKSSKNNIASYKTQKQKLVDKKKAIIKSQFASFSGFITNVSDTIFDGVSLQDSSYILSISNDNDMYIVAEVNLKYWNSIEVEQSVKLTGTWFEGEINGSVSNVSHSISEADNSTFTVKCSIDEENVINMCQGASVNCRIYTEEPYNVYAINSTDVFYTENAESCVYAVSDKGIVSVEKIEILSSSDGRVYFNADEFAKYSYVAADTSFGQYSDGDLINVE